MIHSKHVPLFAALILLAVGGVFLLNKAQRQTHDTTRKHHLQDIESSLYFVQSLAGTYPPYEESSWCGFLNAPENEGVRDQVEEGLRAQNEKYANEEKPFPTDPLYQVGSSDETIWDYFYWKRSPSSFELYAVLEQEKNGDRNSLKCPNQPGQFFDYGIASIQREHPGRTIIETGV